MVARFRSYFELPVIGIAITSPDKGWLDVNVAVCEMLGYTRTELMQMTWAELTHPDDITTDLVQFNRVQAGEIEGYRLEKRFIHKAGHSVYIDLAVQCLRRPDRSVNYFVALLQDITERKQAETALRDEADRRWVTISVKDTGPGITSDDLPHIFERFYRGRAAANYKTAGTGIGLSISREIAEQLGGRLTVETQVGVGSTFILWLPVAAGLTRFSTGHSEPIHNRVKHGS